MLAAVQRPISPACITRKVGRPLWRERPSWWLLAEADRRMYSVKQIHHAQAAAAVNALAQGASGE